DVGKLKAKGDIGVFIGYSKESAAFRIYNKRTLSKVSEASKKDLEDLFQDFYDEYFDSSKIMKSSTMNVETSINEEVFHKVSESFQGESSSSSLNDDVQQSSEEVILPQTNTQSISNNMIPNVDEASTSHNVFNERLEDAYFDATLTYADWVSAMQEELDQFARLKVWRLVPRHEGKSVIKTKWIFKNKKDESSLEEVYVGQPPGFVRKQYPDHVYALDKALYGLKQAPQAWHDVLSQFLIESGFQKGSIDTTLFIKKKVSTPMVEQVKLKLDLVGKTVDHTDYRSMIGSLMYVTSSRPDIMFVTCLCARYQVNPNEHHVSTVKRIFRYLKGTIDLGLWYPKDSGFDLTAYSDADHAGCHLDRKIPTPMVEQAKLKLDLVGKPVDHTDYRSMIGSLMYVTSSRPDIMFATCDKLVCWSSKKQNCVSISTAESEYVAVSGCCAQVLWMRTQLTDYVFFYEKVPIYCDSKSAIAISCNLVQYTHTKHIDVRYHFIKDDVEKGTIELYFVGTEYQLADLFTKSLPEARFKFLVEKLGMMSRET
nr:hypothetical protein [Tanacetum cinerariifolium]